MIPEILPEILKHEGVVALSTLGESGADLVNTWNSYLQLTSEGEILIPAGFTPVIEANIARDNRIVMTLGSRGDGAGRGCQIKGTVAFVTCGANFAAVKERFRWARGALVVTVASSSKTR